jgi:hypothetical protein
MRTTLMEAYAKKLTLAESIYKTTHEGRSMSYSNKVATAVVLNNVNRVLTEAFEQSVGTQRADMGDYKKFCLSITNVVFPSLIAEDLVIVKPMTSISGVITYAKFTYGSNKGGIAQGQKIADPWSIAPRTEANEMYTGAQVVEKGGQVPAWTPIVKGAFTDETGAKHDVKILAADGGVTFGDLTEDGKLPAGDRVAYVYDNVKIPQNDLPIVNMSMEQLPLVAKARRVAIYYSQIAAFQAKTDYGFDMGKELAEKACAELSFEIDEEIINFLAAMGRKEGNKVAAARFNKSLPVGVSKRDHYESFIECIEAAKVAIYNRTQKYMPSYMLCASDVLPILAFVPTFKPASLTNVAGPFMAGTVQGLKVFVSPSLKEGEWFLGVNGNDMTTSAAVYAPYMPIIPTQLVGYADGGMSQGFSTMYDLKALNEQLVVGAEIVNKPEEYVVHTTKAGD